MPNDNKPNPRHQPVAKTSVTYTMIHPQGLDPSKMDPEDIAYHLGDGEFVGARTAVETAPIEDANVAAELEAVGGNPDWFEAENEDAADPEIARANQNARGRP